MSGSPGLPTIDSSRHGIEGEHHFEVFHEANAPMCDTAPIGDPSAFRMHAVDYLVDDVLVGRLRFGPQLLRRKQTHVDAGGTNWIALIVHHAGGARGVAGRGTAIDMQPAQVSLLNLCQPFTALFGQQDSTWILVPRRRLDRADELGPSATIDTSSVRGRIARATVHDLWTKVVDARADEAEQLGGQIVETVDTLLDQDEWKPTDRDLALAMRDFVGVNLSNLDLCIDDLCATFHCSRATVYRSFKPSGGVAAFVREQRLLRCFDELSRPTKLTRLVSEIATRWGFDNPSHFNRLFNAQFGINPSDVAGAARAAIGHQADLGVDSEHLFQDWSTRA